MNAKPTTTTINTNNNIPETFSNMTKVIWFIVVVMILVVGWTVICLIQSYTNLSIAPQQFIDTTTTTIMKPTTTKTPILQVPAVMIATTTSTTTVTTTSSSSSSSISSLSGVNLSVPTETTTTTTTTTPVVTVVTNITLLVHLRGELGNHLALLANARITQYIAEQHYSHILRIHIIGQHQNHKKWKHAYHDIQTCFPQLKDFIFRGGIYDDGTETANEFRLVKERQEQWLTTSERLRLTNARKDGLDFLVQLIQQQQQQQQYSESNHPMDSNTSSSHNHNPRYSLPYLITNEFVWEEILYNTTYYNTIRQYLQYNTSSELCCSNILQQQQQQQINSSSSTTTNTTTTPKEIVYHHRNFMTEMKQRAVANHFTEATPETVVQFMFGNRSIYNHNTTTIRIVSRYEQGLDLYITALQNQNGIPTRMIHSDTTNHTTNTGVQDFCYLLLTPYEIIGKYHSTFVRYAALLGNAQQNRFYGLNQNIIIFDSNNNNHMDHNNNNNYTSATHPIHLLEYITQSNRTFISEQYWQPFNSTTTG